ncbi:MAG: protein phosphatase [Hyphomicrobiales bacterium]|nr:protein phosphatase [Hyphomicrobiales bacterium]MCP5000380.1 protein phosphatase [Hyphomicrobiales bacterium]
MTRDIPSGLDLYSIATLALEGGGRIGVCPLPGRYNELTDDLKTIVDWKPAIVLSLTEMAEMVDMGSGELGVLLSGHGIGWEHLPIRDWGGLTGDNAQAWPALSSKLHDALDRGQGVLTHCRGGHGRSGMIALRLMVERGEDADTVLKRLRYVRPGAVEAPQQMAWAMGIN